MKRTTLFLVLAGLLISFAAVFAAQPPPPPPKYYDSATATYSSPYGFFAETDDAPLQLDLTMHGYGIPGRIPNSSAFLYGYYDNGADPESEIFYSSYEHYSDTNGLGGWATKSAESYVSGDDSPYIEYVPYLGTYFGTYPYFSAVLRGI